jgi:hypothetical protein
MRLLVFAGASAVLILSFQNCSKVNFGVSEDALSTNSLSVNDKLIVTSMNTPIDFQVEHTSSVSGLQLSFQAADSSTPLNGTIEVIDPVSFKFRYSPNFGFRGKDYAKGSVKDRYGNQINFSLTAVVGNTLSALEPALAVRGMGCIQCHAQVDSNIVTDFGFKNDYYFSQKPAANWWNNGGVYGDHANNFNTIAMPAEKSVIVPKAALPSTVASALKLNTLADYIKAQLASSAITSTQGARVLEKGTVYIGAPTESDISNAFKLTSSDRLKYFKNSDTSVALSGLLDQGTFFQNSGTLTCEGDLALRGPLLLDNLQINSKTGCRLYVIGSVFMYGAITYVNNDSDRNLQITSTKSISMGLGEVKKSGSFCEPNGRYATDPANNGTSSLTNRYSTFWTVPGNFVRQSADPKAYGSSILAEAALITAKVGPLYDAACRAEGRNVSFERILLNAPIVHSRYEGNISGTIIAEFSIMSLGAFKFSFDTVFNEVPVFPFLDKKTYLDVED